MKVRGRRFSPPLRRFRPLATASRAGDGREANDAGADGAACHQQSAYGRPAPRLRRAPTSSFPLVQESISKLITSSLCWRSAPPLCLPRRSLFGAVHLPRPLDRCCGYSRASGREPGVSCISVFRIARLKTSRRIRRLAALFSISGRSNRCRSFASFFRTSVGRLRGPHLPARKLFQPRMPAQ